MHKIKLSYLLVLLFSLAFAFLVGGPMPYLLLYIVILSFLVPMVHLLVSLLGLKTKLSIDKDQLYAGDSVILKYTIMNKNFFIIPMLETIVKLDKDYNNKNIIFKKLSLNPFEENTSSELILFERRGFYEKIDFKISISDIYSLFNLKKTINNNLKLIVYPKIIELDSFKIISDKSFGNLSVQDSIFQDKTSINTIKDYVEGDSLNQIHWKLSAKRGAPMIKSFENISNTKVHIFIESKSSFYKEDVSYRMEDKIVESALSIVNYLLNLDLSLTLNTFSKNHKLEMLKSNKNDLKSFLEFFAKFKANGQISVLDLVEENFYSFTQNSIVMIISPILNKNMGSIGLKLKTKGLIPIFIIATDKINNNSNIDLHIKNRLIEEDIDLYIIDSKTNIKEVLEMKND